ncbi:NUDIX hydrolase [Paenibacillus xylanexedens]|uniref:NUDIX hydrolase n=1 Tax=Paenibacillus xylanexedens TaxID=528191 RepID=UPI00119DD13A|nr:NUDIX hydrolase [Paenibacillus xylanexedens]
MGYITELRTILGSRPLILTGSCVLVFNEQGHVLLQKRTDSLDWGTIGGSMELGESLEETAARELYEEAGLRAGAYRLITVFSGQVMYYRYPHGDEIYNVMAVYEALDVEGEPRIMDDEGLELRYFDLSQPIPEINPITAYVLQNTGYIKMPD